MAKVVIDMPDYMLNQIMKGYPFKLPSQFVTETYKIIRNGKILPKGHGRLIDENTIEIPFDVCDGEEAFDYVVNAPTIIEADKTESEG